jgi:putative copper resistance protein D
MLMHFLTVGLLFFGPILAIDPWPRRSAPGLRLIELLIAVPFHAFFGVVVMQTAYPLSTIFAGATTALGLDPIADQ